jgi:hypothetical protein
MLKFIDRTLNVRDILACISKSTTYFQLNPYSLLMQNLLVKKLTFDWTNDNLILFKYF